MSSSFMFLAILLSLLIAAVYGHNDHQHNHHRDDKWITFVSQIESFWKTDETVLPPSTETHTKTSINSKEVYTSEKTTEAESYNLTPESTILNGTTHFEERVKLGLGAIISIPIVGIVILVCCCYCICKCCCGMCSSDDKNVIIMNSNPAQPPQPTHVIVQQPIYQHSPPPRQEMGQYPPPHQQWGPPQSQQPMPPPQFQQMPPPQYHFQDGIQNPNFYQASAPPQMSPERY